MQSWNELHLGEEALGGLSAGVVGTVIGFPLDVVKTRMQTGSSNGKSIFSVGKEIVRNEGVFSLYKGMTPPLISLSILNTITFTQFTFYREIYNANPGWDYRNALAGITCAPIGSVISTVENLVKVSIGFVVGIVVGYPLIVYHYLFLTDFFSGVYRHKCNWTMSQRNNSRAPGIV
jgi:hypothetical protein